MFLHPGGSMAVMGERKGQRYLTSIFVTLIGLSIMRTGSGSAAQDSSTRYIQSSIVCVYSNVMIPNKEQRISNQILSPGRMDDREGAMRSQL